MEREREREREREAMFATTKQYSGTNDGERGEMMAGGERRAREERGWRERGEEGIEE